MRVDRQQLGDLYVRPGRSAACWRHSRQLLSRRQHPLVSSHLPKLKPTPDRACALPGALPKIASAYQHNGRSLGQTVNVCRCINIIQLSNICAAHRFTSDDGTSSISSCALTLLPPIDLWVLQHNGKQSALFRGINQQVYSSHIGPVLEAFAAGLAPVQLSVDNILRLPRLGSSVIIGRRQAAVSSRCILCIVLQPTFPNMAQLAVVAAPMVPSLT